MLFFKGRVSYTFGFMEQSLFIFPSFLGLEELKTFRTILGKLLIQGKFLGKHFAVMPAASVLTEQVQPVENNQS